MTEVIVDNKLQSNLNSLIENTPEQEKRMEEDLDFFFNNNTSQVKRKKKKRKYKTKKIKPYNTTIDKIEELSNEHFVGWGEGRRFI